MAGGGPWVPDLVDPSISSEDFWRRYVATRTPCVLDGLPWPAAGAISGKGGMKGGKEREGERAEGEGKERNAQAEQRGVAAWADNNYLRRRAGQATVSVEYKDSRVTSFGRGRKVCAARVGRGAPRDGYPLPGGYFLWGVGF